MRRLFLALVVPALLFPGDAGAQPIRDDLADLMAGKFSHYSTKGHAKAGSVDLSIKYPSAWNRSEGERPHVVQKMTRTIGVLSYGISILITDPADEARNASTAEMEELFKSAEFIEMVAPPAAKVHSRTVTRFEGRPAALVEFGHVGERLGARMQMRAIALVFLLDGRLVTIIGDITTVEGVNLDAQFSVARPLFMAVFNDSVLNNVWKSHATTTPVTVPAPEPFVPRTKPPLKGDRPVRSIPETSSAPYRELDQITESWHALILSLVLTWTIGPAPAVLLRFAVFRRQLPSRAAKIYAFAISAVFWFVGMSIHNATDEPGTYRGTVWFVMYLVSWGILRWRGSTQDATAPSSADARPSVATASTAMPTASGPAPKPSVAAPLTAIPIFESPVAAPQASAPPQARPSGGRLVEPQPQKAPIVKLPRLPPPLPPKPPGAG
jgi:hypothetical protein